ncbi:unnamed protein product [Caenorhabditis auriculariae]|uniref:Uncharacterized protein n=1 Tax=Caenorhabditis auriculariae TaxID=2777116 RepID=A0A8S1GZB9_9PELO|nr:unnamed protein product [Caenorhabditis auriculariae]
MSSFLLSLFFVFGVLAEVSLKKTCPDGWMQTRKDVCWKMLRLNSTSEYLSACAKFSAFPPKMETAEDLALVTELQKEMCGGKRCGAVCIDKNGGSDFFERKQASVFHANEATFSNESTEFVTLFKEPPIAEDNIYIKFSMRDSDFANFTFLTISDSNISHATTALLLKFQRSMSENGKYSTTYHVDCGIWASKLLRCTSDPGMFSEFENLITLKFQESRITLLINSESACSFIPFSPRESEINGFKFTSKGGLGAEILEVIAGNIDLQPTYVSPYCNWGMDEDSLFVPYIDGSVKREQFIVCQKDKIESKTPAGLSASTDQAETQAEMEERTYKLTILIVVHATFVEAITYKKRGWISSGKSTSTSINFPFQRKMQFTTVLLAVLALLAVGFAPTNAETCRRTKCHTHSSQNECEGDEHVGNWGYCWGVAGKWESCCKN